MTTHAANTSRSQALQRPAAWLDDAAPLLSSVALTLLGLLAVILVGNMLGIESRLRTMLVFVSGILVLPVTTVTLQNALDQRWPKAARIVEALNIWCAILALAGLSAVAVMAWRSRGLDFWSVAGLMWIRLALGLYAAGLALLLMACLRTPMLDRVSAIVRTASSRAMQTTAFAFAFAIAAVALFKIEPDHRHFNAVFGFVFRTVTDGFPDRSTLVWATGASALFVLVGFGLLLLERRLAIHDPARLRRLQSIALVIAIVASTVLAFDFSFAADSFHYMTVVGPALHLLHGGTLMVDTFSQYGPGPVLVAWLAFKIGPPSFAVANLAIQLCNLAFYALFLIALWQSTRMRISAVWFGLVFILFWLSGWDNGQGNVNTAPSVLGGRYLPILLMAVALGARRGQRHTALTFLSAFLSSLWSIEAFIGSLALYAGSLTLEDLRARAYRRIASDLVIAALPMAAGLAALCAYTRVAAGRWPAFDIYLGFLSSYNPLAPFWSVPFDARFWGWMPILAAVARTVAGCWLLAIDPRRVSLQAPASAWLRNALPAAILTALTGSYFAGRSVDFTIVIALLPFAMLVVPAMLWLSNRALDRDRIAAVLATLAALVVFWASIFACLYVLRLDSPYALLLQECRDHGRCTPATLGRILPDTVERERALKSRNTFWSLDEYDQTIVADADRLIAQYVTGPKAAVLLGESASGWQMLSDITLMYANKGDTFSRSFTFTDELVPALFTAIVGGVPTPASGDVMLVRRDETTLGRLEQAILETIRARGSLCELQGSSTSNIVAYEFRKRGASPEGTCAAPQPVTTVSASEPLAEPVDDLGALIENLRAARQALPNGPLDLSTLERAHVAVPERLSSGRRLVTFSGFMALQKDDSRLTIDLFAFPRTACMQLLAPLSRLPGMDRIAVTATLADEQKVPVSRAQSEALCSQNTRHLRMIVDLGSH